MRRLTFLIHANSKSIQPCGPFEPPVCVRRSPNGAGAPDAGVDIPHALFMNKQCLGRGASMNQECLATYLIGIHIQENAYRRAPVALDPVLCHWVTHLYVKFVTRFSVYTDSTEC